MWDGKQRGVQRVVSVTCGLAGSQDRAVFRACEACAVAADCGPNRDPTKTCGLISDVSDLVESSFVILPHKPPTAHTPPPATTTAVCTMYMCSHYHRPPPTTAVPSPSATQYDTTHDTRLYSCSALLPVHSRALKNAINIRSSLYFVLLLMFTVTFYRE